MGQDDPIIETTETTEDPVKALQRQLDAAVAAVEAAELRRKSRFAVPDMQRELERATQAAKDVAALEEIEAEHGREGFGVGVVRTTYGIVVLKKPSRLRYTRFVDAGKHNLDNIEILTKECLLYPSKDEFQVLCNRETDTIRRCGNAIAYLHGVRVEKELPGK